jgi:hypothetical protein
MENMIVITPVVFVRPRHAKKGNGVEIILDRKGIRKVGKVAALKVIDGTGTQIYFDRELIG